LPTAAEEEYEQRAAVLARLWDEFARLNREHFGGALTLSEIVMSSRKQYGGYYRKDKNRIVISWRAYQEHGWDEIVHTLRHEVAHLVHFDHSTAFWELAAHLGCTRRHALPPLARPTTYTRYVYECPACHDRVFRRRRITRRASCGRCAKGFDPAFLLRLVSK
jgi:predicted SprT family Zn-dependent metalloprotease